MIKIYVGTYARKNDKKPADNKKGVISRLFDWFEINKSKI